MKTVLLTSSYPESVVAEVRRRWKVVNIPNQREAMEYLKSGQELPSAASIGCVDSASSRTDLDAKAMLREIHKLDPNLPVIISTHQQTASTIVDFIKRGAFDYVVEPPNDQIERFKEYAQDLIFALNRAVQWREMTQENQKLKQDLARRDQPEFIKGRSAAILHVLELIRKVAPTSATVLITGESGTGKELVARAIHTLSPHREHSFTAVNCGAISENLLASELFGHVKGAFTGAHADRPGLISETGSGTLFLDEIATVPASFQVMLLRVLEQRTARQVGGTGDYPIQCRFLSAANSDLEELVRQNRFREDLYYRLNVFHIHMPPLRDRREDIPILADYFLHQASQQLGKIVRGISPAAMEVLEEYAWPGNVRQLRHAIERAVILCDGDALGIEDLDSRLRQASASSVNDQTAQNYNQAMAEFERGLILSALGTAKGNRSKAARLLEMNRATLNYRVKQLGLER